MRESVEKKELMMDKVRRIVMLFVATGVEVFRRPIVAVISLFDSQSVSTRPSPYSIMSAAFFFWPSLLRVQNSQQHEKNNIF